MECYRENIRKVFESLYIQPLRSTCSTWGIILVCNIDVSYERHRVGELSSLKAGFKQQKSIYAVVEKCITVHRSTDNEASCFVNIRRVDLYEDIDWMNCYVWTIQQRIIHCSRY